MVNIERMWTELFRPRNLSQVVGQNRVVTRLKELILRDDLPHLLFSGPPGVGKTTCAEAIVNEIFSKGETNNNVIRLNASDDRGIRVVREDIKNFSRRLPFGDAKFKIIILDEADQMTHDAQHALRQLMEKYNAISRFILICNYSSRIIPPIQSRCSIFRFKSLDSKSVIKRLQEIAKVKNVDIEDDAFEALFDVSNGDIRQAINTFQAASAQNKAITAELVYDIQGYVKPVEIDDILLECFKEKPNYRHARSLIKNIMEKYGLAGEDIIKYLNTSLNRISENKLSNEEIYEAISMLSDVDYRISAGCNPDIQLDAYLAKLIALKMRNR